MITGCLTAAVSMQVFPDSMVTAGKSCMITGGKSCMITGGARAA
jgi:hypothetical protein